MAHKINEILDRAEKKIPVKCSKECDYFAFPRLPRACVLSDVYSVNQGELCYIFKEKKVDTAR